MAFRKEFVNVERRTLRGTEGTGDWPCPKSRMAERDKLILGARAPSPAMSAKRETVTASRSLRLSVLRTLRRARAPALPVLTGSFHIRSTFLGKAGSARDFDTHDSAYMGRSYLFLEWHSTHWNIEMSPRFTGCWK